MSIRGRVTKRGTSSHPEPDLIGDVSGTSNEQDIGERLAGEGRCDGYFGVTPEQRLLWMKWKEELLLGVRRVLETRKWRVPVDRVPVHGDAAEFASLADTADVTAVAGTAEDEYKSTDGRHRF